MAGHSRERGVSNAENRAARPRVAQVCLHVGQGGAERYLLSLARELAPEWPTLVVAAAGSWLEREAAAAGLEVATIPEPRGGLSVRTVCRLVRLLRTGGVRIIHSHLGISDWYAWLASACVRNALLVSTEHGISADHPELFTRTSTSLRQLVHRLAHCLRLQSTDAVIAVSTYTREAMRARYGQRATQRVVVIRPGIDPSRFPLSSFARPGRSAALGGNASPLRLVYVGRLEPEKGPDLLLEAVMICGSRGLRLALTIVGDGSLRASLQTVIPEGAPVEVRWVGHTDPQPFLSEGDLFILPSRSENLPIAVLEAMTMGLPILATSVGGVPEVVRNGITGLLVEPENASALAAAIEKLHADRALLAQMSSAARSEAAEYDIASMAERVSDLYDQSAQAKTAGAGASPV